jgi:hypothetical protein
MASRWPTHWLLAGLAGAALAACAGLWALLPPDPLEAARRRVPLGADQEAVEAAVGRPGTVVYGKVDPTDAASHQLAVWEYGDALLRVEFDENGRAVKVDVVSWRDPTPWKRFLTWLGW